jgi:hypothetical protein
VKGSFVRLLGAVIALAMTPAGIFAANTVGLQPGKVVIRSAGPLAFGPNGVLFVGDTLGAAIVAIDTDDTTAPAKTASIEIKELNKKIAAALGTTPDQILINDAVVNPLSRKIYFSVSRGRGPEATPVILRADAAGNLTELPLDNARHAKMALPDAPDENAKDQRGSSRRLESITDLGFVDGKVVIAGLSNEEFSSTLRVMPYPFRQANKGAGVEIYHGSHGRFETNAPVRTFVPYEIAGKPHILAAYTCTPLVRIPVSDLAPGAKVKGTTIAELGNRNRPLDMIAYRKDGKQYILMANSSRGVMKLAAENLDSYKAITAHTEKEGVPYETIASLKGVQQLDKLDDTHAILVTDEAGSLDLRTIALP